MEAGQEVVTKDQVPSVPLIHPPAILFLDTIKLGLVLGNNLFLLYWELRITGRS